MSENTKTLSLEDTFHFSCHSEIDCFSQCCQDVNILLTPYDILQMKRRLGISSTEFLKRYTKTLISPQTLLPAVQFKLDEENNKRCYFVSEKGCEIYDHRPWSCRMYPLDNSPEGEGFSPMVDSTRCLGLKDNTVWQLRDWLEEQGLEPYNDWSLRFAELTEDEKLTGWRKKHPAGLEIFHLTCYDLDRFRDIVFKEKLYEMVEPQLSNPDKLRTDDLALLDFAFSWLQTVAGQKSSV